MSAARKIFSNAEKHPRITIALFILLGLGPFLNKAVHMDDPLFVWTAQQILKHPGDFFGFAVNWYGDTKSIFLINMNPPGQSYLLAGVMAIFGDQEIPLHAAMMLVAFAAAAGIFQLAQSWCERPLLATLLAMSTPVFLVSATTLMCDVPMLALWIWAVVFWERALKNGAAGNYLTAGILAGLSVLTKYSALTLLPLLFVLGALRIKRPGWWLLWLAVPVVMIEAYQLWTAKLYGLGLLSEASLYAARNRSVMGGGLESRAIFGPAYLGACLVPVLFLAGQLWNRRTLLIAGPLLLAVAFAAVKITGIGSDLSWSFRLQMVVVLIGGIHLLLLAVVELWQRRDPISLLLALWIGSGFLFAGILNWTVSSRSFLPLIPAAGILVARRLARKHSEPPRLCTFAPPLVISAGLGLLVAGADFSLANSAREAARQLAAKYITPSNQLWFQGHWGWQYYLQKAGATPVDKTRTVLAPGEIMIMPSNNTNLVPPGSNDVDIVEVLAIKVLPWLSTDHSVLGAGFYGTGIYITRGYLPFVFGRVPEEIYYVCRARQILSFTAPEQGQVDEALIQFEKALKNNPDDAKTRNNFGIALRKAGRLDEAIAQYQYALKINPNYAQAHYNLGNALYQKGQVNDAILHYQDALAIVPDNVMLQRNLAHTIWLLATSTDASVRNGTNAVAFADAENKLLGGNNPMILRVLAAAYAESGNFSEAIDTGNQALARAAQQQNLPLQNALQQEISLYQEGKAMRADANDMNGW
jgi:tetratricopeptide (TPR) repeat protein/4-amino-4-deoxy-L-arabinose transferase-like glycosyltransferase